MEKPPEPRYHIQDLGPGDRIVFTDRSQLPEFEAQVTQAVAPDQWRQAYSQMQKWPLEAELQNYGGRRILSRFQAVVMEDPVGRLRENLANADKSLRELAGVSPAVAERLTDVEAHTFGFVVAADYTTPSGRSGGAITASAWYRPGRHWARREGGTAVVVTDYTRPPVSRRVTEKRTHVDHTAGEALQELGVQVVRDIGFKAIKGAQS